MRRLRGLASLLVACPVLFTGGCLLSGDDEGDGGGARRAGPELTVSIDSVYAWFPVDPGRTWEWNRAPEGTWEHVWDASVDVAEFGASGSSVHVAFVRPSEGGTPRIGTLRELAAGATVYFWTEDLRTGSWNLKPLPAGQLRVRDDGVGVRMWDSAAGWVYAYAPTHERFWLGTFRTREPGAPEGVVQSRVHYIRDRSQDVAREIEGPLDPEEYAVMHVVIADYLRDWRPDEWYLLTPSATGTLKWEAENLRVLRAEPETVSAYFEARGREVDLRAFGQIGFATADADSFYQAPHDAALFNIRLSGVGFNPARDQALLYGSYDCGSLCAEGEVLLLEKIDGCWLIRDRVQMWIS